MGVNVVGHVESSSSSSFAYQYQHLKSEKKTESRITIRLLIIELRRLECYSDDSMFDVPSERPLRKAYSKNS